MTETPSHAEARAFLAKARQNLDAAEADFDAGRHDACASRAYYACFQAAIAALLVEGIQPGGRSGQWSHEFVQAQFAGVLVGRRKRYAAALRTTLMDTLDIRHRADYQPQPITRREAHEALQRARRLVAAVEENIPWRQRSSD